MKIIIIESERSRSEFLYVDFFRFVRFPFERMVYAMEHNSSDDDDGNPIYIEPTFPPTR